MARFQKRMEVARIGVGENDRVRLRLQRVVKFESALHLSLPERPGNRIIEPVADADADVADVFRLAVEILAVRFGERADAGNSVDPVFIGEPFVFRGDGPLGDRELARHLRRGGQADRLPARLLNQPDHLMAYQQTCSRLLHYRILLFCISDCIGNKALILPFARVEKEKKKNLQESHWRRRVPGG